MKRFTILIILFAASVCFADGPPASIPKQVTSAEITAGTETAKRSWSPQDIATAAGTHGGAGNETTVEGYIFDADAETVSGVWTFSANPVCTAYPWAVNEGGTGAGTLTDGGILLGSGTGAITALGVATNGQIPIGDGTTDPVLATITGTANEITVTNGAGTITLDIPDSPVFVTPALGTVASGIWNGTAIGLGYGGLGANVSAATGLIGITGGAAQEVDLLSELNAHIADATLLDDGAISDSTAIGLTAGDSYTNFGSASDDSLNEMFAALDTALGGLGGATAYNSIGDPTGAGSISFDDGETATYDGANDNETFFTISLNAADLTGDTTGLLITAVDNDDSNYIPLLIQDDQDGTPDDLFKVDYQGNVSIAGTLTYGASASPGVWFQDSDCPGTDKDVGSVQVVYVDGADGSENADMLFYVTQGGVEDTEILRFDESDDRWETSKAIAVNAIEIVGSDGEVNAAAIEDAYLANNGDVGTGVYDFGGATTFEIPNQVASDLALTALGQIGIDDTDDALVWHDGANGEVAGEVQVSAIYHKTWSFDPDAICDGDVDRLFLMTVGDEAPNGIIIDEWKVSFEADPTTEADLDLKYADAFIGVANSAVIDVLDTTAGVASEDTDANINSGAAVANTKVIYLEFGTAYTETGHQIIFELWYHLEED